MLSELEEANELARLISLAARAKVDDGEAKKKVETPYQRLFKKTYNTVWEVSVAQLSKKSKPNNL